MAIRKKPGRKRPPVSRAAAKRRAGKSSSRQNEIEDEIHRLECFVVEAPRKLREKRLSDRTLVRPSRSRKDKTQERRRNVHYTRAQVAAIRRERIRNMMVFFGLLVVLYFLVAWLLEFIQKGNL